MIVAILLLLAEQATNSQTPTADKSSVFIVAAIGAFATLAGIYFTYRGSKKQTEVTSESQERDAVLKEREQLSDEWKALREYQSVQLSAARKEIEALERQIRVLKSAINDRDTDLDLLNDQVFALEHNKDKLERDNAVQKRQLDFPTADK